MKIATPIFVTGCARSGTTLMTRLLDGHPDVVVFPTELKYFRHLNLPSIFPRSKLAQHQHPRDAVLEVVSSAYLSPLYGEPETVGGRKRVLEVAAEKIDATTFRDALHDVAEVTDHGSALLHFFTSLMDGLGRPRIELERVHLVEKTPFQEENVELLLEAFPDARFIHMVRNPYAVMASWRNRAVRQLPKPELPDMQRSSLELARANRARFGEIYRVVRYEDLVSDTKSEVSAAAEFLGLPFDPVLLEPMILGEPWQGNSSIDEKQFSGVSREMVDAWRSDILPIEVLGVNRVVGDLVSAFHYERLPDPSTLSLPRGYPLRKLRQMRYMLGLIREASQRGSH